MNIFECVVFIFSIMLILLISPKVVKSINESKLVRLRKGRKERRLIEDNTSNICIECWDYGADVYDDTTKAWYHKKCYKDFYKL